MINIGIIGLGHNCWRPHQALDHQTPSQVYEQGLHQPAVALSLTMEEAA